MKPIKNTVLFIGSVLFISAASFIKNNYTLSKDYVVTIHGTSNLHAWDEKVEQVTGNAVVEKNKDGSLDLTDMTIKMNVRSIKSDMGGIMNDNTYKALKADANPNIIFTLLVPVTALVVPKKQVAVKGNLTIAGATKAVTMQVNVSMSANQELTFEGAQNIKMSDYNITPPTALLGTLKTGDDITIHFKTNFILNTP